MSGPGLPIGVIESGFENTSQSFVVWQQQVLSELETFAAEQLRKLGVFVTATVTDESECFGEKIALLAHYSNPGNPYQAFPIFSREVFEGWISGVFVPSVDEQGVIIQHCRITIANSDNFHEGSAVERLLQYLFNSQRVKLLTRVTLSPTQLFEDKHSFDPWQKIDDAPLSVRAQNALKNRFITYIGQLAVMTEKELLLLPNVGRKTVEEIREYLGEAGATLGMESPLLLQFKLATRLAYHSARWISGNLLIEESGRAGCFSPLKSSYVQKLHDAGLITLGQVAVAKQAQVEELLGNDSEAIKLVESKLALHGLELGMTLDPKLLALMK